MKKHLESKWWSFVLAVMMCSQLVMAQKTEVEPVSKLQKITVFTDRAMISKETAFSVKRGENIIRITGMTPYLVDQSGFQVSF